MDIAGLVGGLESLNDALEQTPLAPLTAVTGALADGLSTVADGLAGVADQDPSGLANLLAETIGQPQDGYSNDQEGLAGVVSNLSQGLAAGSAGGPLDPVVNSLAQTLGFSEESEVDGVAQGLTAAGNVLASDESQLSVLTADLLAPVVGTSDMDAGSPGLSGTLQEVGEGLTDLTNEDSALAPLSPLTEGLAFVVAGGEDPTGGQLPEELSGGLAGGVGLLGQALVDGSEMAGPGAALVETVGNLLGGTRPTGDDEPDNGGGIPETPLSPLTDALMENADPAVFAGNLAGVIEDIGQNSPLEAVTGPIADALAGGVPTLPGMPGEGGTDGPTGTPLDVILAPLADAAGGGLPTLPGLPGNGGTPTPNPVAGPFESAAQQFVDLAPIEMIPVIGQPIEDGILTGAALLDSILAGGLPGLPGEGGTDGPTGTPLDAVLAPLADAAGGGLPTLPGLPGEGGTDGPTGTPLDAILAPLADAAGGGLPTLPGLPGEGGTDGPTGTPLDAILAPLADAAGGGLPTLPGLPGEGGTDGPTGTPLDAVLAPLADAAGGGLPIPTDASALTDLLGGSGLPISTITDLLDPSALPIPGLPTA
ncbi:hypothetical protein RGQ30_03860 [Limnobacter thiooxidans]|uniref:Uncharacterized protein n=1 Tax=Limnobacter thiooxidans TaxID=131080 RepID=A0AA86J5V1_9BURK|nr:hypothetical protein RGQ30_03860 [Limnobacter thiooxidans]